MNFQQLIDKRKWLSFDQRQELKAIICHGLQKQHRLAYIAVIDNSFYTLFDKSPYATKFFIYNDRVEHNLNKDGLKAFRQYIKENFL